VVTRRLEGGEKERGKENRLEIHVFRLDLSLYSGHRSGRAWVSARSVKPTHVHRCRFDRSDRIRPKTNYLQSRDPVVHPVPTDHPNPIARLQSPAGERKKYDGFVLKRKKQENKKKKKTEKKKKCYRRFQKNRL